MKKSAMIKPTVDRIRVYWRALAEENIVRAANGFEENLCATASLRENYSRVLACIGVHWRKEMKPRIDANERELICLRIEQAQHNTLRVLRGDSPFREFCVFRCGLDCRIFYPQITQISQI